THIDRVDVMASGVPDRNRADAAILRGDDVQAGRAPGETPEDTAAVRAADRGSPRGPRRATRRSREAATPASSRLANDATSLLLDVGGNRRHVVGALGVLRGFLHDFVVVLALRHEF